jgi:hypothetical protein
MSERWADELCPESPQWARDMVDDKLDELYAQIHQQQDEIERLREAKKDALWVINQGQIEINRLCEELLSRHNELRAKADEIERLRAARTELVTALHDIASHFENALYAFRDDTEARKKAEGDIAHAMKIAAQHNRNGRGVLSNRDILGEVGAKALADAKEEISRLHDELAIWKSVFPDIAPEEVQPNRTILLSEIDRLRGENTKLLGDRLLGKSRLMQKDLKECRDVIDRAAKAWLSVDSIAWEGDVGDAMAAAVKEIKRLRDELRVALDEKSQAVLDLVHLRTHFVKIERLKQADQMINNLGEQR